MERNQYVTKFEAVLGAAVIAILAVGVVPMLRGEGADGGVRKATAAAETIAQAVIDYRVETGDWPPRDGGGGLDPSCLTGPGARVAHQAALVGAMGAAPGEGADVGRPWLEEIPLDPWYRPYRVHVVDDGGPAARLVVISAGPDGTFQTTPERLRTLRVGAGHGAFGGDDAGCVLAADRRR